LDEQQRENAANVRNLTDRENELNRAHAADRNSWNADRLALENKHKNEIKECNVHLDKSVKDYENRIDELNA